MSGFGGNVVRKSSKSKKSKDKKRSKGRNLKAVAKFKAGDDFAMMEAAMEYQLESTLATLRAGDTANGSYY